MTTLDALRRAIVADPQNEDRWSVLADYLEEHDDPRRATLLRLHRKLLATCCEPEKHPERADWQARIVALLAEGVRPCVPTRSVVLGEGLEMGFAFIPPGTFLMGSPEGEKGRRADEVLHRVTLTRGFWIGVYPVTQAQWKAVMGSSPSAFKGDDQPAEQVSWDDYVAFCGRLGEGVRLPTEAEWEYACRAGTTTPFHFGEAISAEQGNHGKGKKGLPPQTTPVGSFPSNAWGLFDLHGNVWEWCHDWYGAYPASDLSDPQGSSSGRNRVLRGGSWASTPISCRSACRFWSMPGNRFDKYGCRLVLCPDE